MNLQLPKKVFITGGSGFIGQALMQKLKSAGVEVIGLARNAGDNSDIISGDISQPGDWCDAMQGCDLVIHSAALVSNDATHEQAWIANVAGTSATLQAAIKAGVKRFLHISSVGVYGYEASDVVMESTPLRFIDHPYSDTKIISEHTVLAAHSAGEIDATIVRPSDVYGPHSRPWVTIPLEVIQKGLMLLPAKGQGMLSPIYIDDLVEGMLLAACKPEGKGQIFNLDGGQSVTCLEFFSHYYRMLGRKGKPLCLSNRSAIAIAEIVGKLERLFGKSSEIGKDSMLMLSRQNSYSISKAQQLLGFQPRVSLDKGMEEVEQWLLSTSRLN